MFETEAVKKVENTHFTFSNIAFLKIVPFTRKRGKIWYSHTGHKRQRNTAYAHCMLGTKGYKHILRTCNTVCISVATLLT